MSIVVTWYVELFSARVQNGPIAVVFDDFITILNSFIEIGVTTLTENVKYNS